MSRGLDFRIPGDGSVLRVEADVLTVFARNRQRHIWYTEACGQLFARFDRENVTIARATGPHKGDRRGRFFCHPDRRVEQSEINEMFAEGLHYVGDWHTHPEPRPSPSCRDEDNMMEILAGARLEVRGLFLIIVGVNDFPGGLWAGLCCSGRKPERLEPIPPFDVSAA